MATKKEVAIKKIHKEFVKETKDEVLIMKKLKHSKFIKLLDKGEKGQLVHSSGKIENGLTYIVMELVKG